MENVKKIIPYCIIVVLIAVIVFKFCGHRDTSKSLEQAFIDLQSAKDITTTAEQQLDKATATIGELREELVEERRNYSRLEQYSDRLEKYYKDLKAEHIKQREIYKEFRITNRTSQESVETISRLIEESRIIITELLSEYKDTED